jgi:hypothetical protein
MKDTVFTANGQSIRKSELVAVFADLVHFGIRWTADGKSYVYNYLSGTYELFSDNVMKQYLVERRKVLGIVTRDNRVLTMIGMIRFLAKEMCVSEKWFPEKEEVPIESVGEIPEMQWEKL